MSEKKLIKMVKIKPGSWTLILSKGKGHLIKIGPFEEWVPQRVVEIADDGTLYLSYSYLTPGRLWTSILKNYPHVKRPSADVNYGESAPRTSGGPGERVMEMDFNFEDDD